MSDGAKGIRGLIAQMRKLDKHATRVSNLPPADAQITTGKGPWRVTRSADGQLLMIEVWTEPALVINGYTFAPQG